MGFQSVAGLPLGRRPVLTAALLVLTGALTGLAVAVIPWAAWVLVGVFSTLLLLLSPAHIRVGASVLAATGSHLLVATGFLPEALNFFHFPLILASALKAATDAAPRSSLRRAVEAGLMAFLSACLLSAVINASQPMSFFLDWLVFAEPFLLVYTLIVMPQDLRTMKALWGLALVIPMIQFPLAVYQALSKGLMDPVQGMFLGMGAGAHIAGAVALLGSLICLARAVVAAKPLVRLFWLLGMALLFLVAVLADAKQVIISFFPALVLLLLSLLRLRWTQVVLALPVLALVTLGAFSYYRPLQVSLDWALISRGVFGKAQAFSVIASRFSSNAGGWIFGLGPGQSISRVALMSLEGYIKLGSPLHLLNLNPARTTLELWNLSASNLLFTGSSVWSPVSSWLGLLGDLGVAGVCPYLWLCLILWRGLKSRSGWQPRVARAMLLMCVPLGFMYSWLEEPGFTMPAALVVGLGLLTAGNENPSGP
jgi:hypothetical protein